MDTLKKKHDDTLFVCAGGQEGEFGGGGTFWVERPIIYTWLPGYFLCTFLTLNTRIGSFPNSNSNSDGNIKWLGLA